MISRLLKAKLVCTWCLGPLSESEGALTCIECGARYPVEEGIPNMLLEFAHVFCPRCRGEMKKGEGVAVCESCRRVFSLKERLVGDAARGEPFCVPCGAKLNPSGGRWTCPKCGKEYSE
jgi:uncharacterized protein YbaR (Trm112 family)